MIKKFSNFLKENASTDWEDSLYDASKEYFYGGEEPSIFNEILDMAFGPEFKGDMPDKEDIKAKFLEWINDAFDKAVFTEDEATDLDKDEETL